MELLSALTGKKGPAAEPKTVRVLVIDIGGTKIKMLATGETEPRKLASGKKAWRELVTSTIETVGHAFVVDYVVLGGGNSKEFKELPPGVRLGNNLTAFRGGFRLWHVEAVQTHSPDGDVVTPVPERATEWRVI